MKEICKKMKSFFNKYIKSALCLMICAAMLSSCGVIVFNAPPVPDDMAEAESSLETNKPYEVQQYDPYSSDYGKELSSFLKDIKITDYNGGTFLIANTKAPLIVADETCSAIISNEYKSRNDYVEEQLNIMLAEKIVHPDNMYNEIRQAIKSNSYYADLILIPQTSIGRYAADGLIANLSVLPGINFDAKYYNSSSVAAAGGNSKIYAIAGDACADYESLSAVFYNKALLSQLTQDNIYSLVDKGEWTWAKFFEYADAVSVLGEGYYSLGYQNTAMYIQDLIFVSAGMQFTSCAYGQMPQIAFTAEEANPVVDIIKKAINHPLRYTNNLEAITAFAGGNTLFLIDKLSTMSALANSSADWGVLPLPKNSAEQAEYKTLAFSDSAMFFAMVPTVSDTQKIADVLAMINISSYGETIDSFANNAMTYYLRDNASTRNVARIMNSSYYDLSYSFASRAKAISNATYMNIRNSSVNFYNVQSYLKSWTKAFNNAMNTIFEN